MKALHDRMMLRLLKIKTLHNGIILSTFKHNAMMFKIVKNQDSPQWYDIVHFERTMVRCLRLLRIKTLHDSMILSTLSISSHRFALGFTGFVPMEMYSFTYKL